MFGGKSCKYSCPVDKNSSLVFKTVERQNVFLTIGIPTVQREKASYFQDTLNSILNSLNEVEQSEVLILVFLADSNQTSKNLVAADLQKNFPVQIKSGLIRVIQAPDSYYTRETIKRLTYGQSKEYVAWRAKQSYDFAYMFKYATNISKYYMQIEDDVVTKPNFLQDIKNYIKEKGEDWVCLEFSELGFIGKLYRTEHLDRLAALMMMFYSEQPVDYTYLLFNHLMVQYGRNIKIPTLFQHKGLTSSRTGKRQGLKDRYFIDGAKTLNGDNPPAEILTNMSPYLSFLPKLAYLKTDGIFWSHGNQKSGDSYTIVFESPQRLKRVAVITGTSENPRDMIYEGKVELSLTFLNKTKDSECTNNIEIGTFKDGVMDNPDLLKTVNFKAMCLQITVTKAKENWVIIREIGVFVDK